MVSDLFPLVLMVMLLVTRISLLYCFHLLFRFLPFGEVKNKKVEDQIQEILDALDLSSVSLREIAMFKPAAGIGELLQ